MNAKTRTSATTTTSAPSFSAALESAKLVQAATAALASVFGRKGIASGVGMPARHNVQPPKKMGECGKVWAACADHYNRTGQVPTPKAMYGHEMLAGANLTNISIECYRWRAYHGFARRAGGQ